MNLMINLSRLHPLLVHLPIGIMFFVAFLYFMKKWDDTNKYDSSIFLGLLVAFGSAIFSAITGWFLSYEGGYDIDLLFWHQWMGISTVVSIFLLLFLYKNRKFARYWYNIVFVLSLVLITLTGHYGGSLTHGSNYLFEKGNSQSTPLITNIEKTPVYESIIQPIIQQKCVACHKSNKKKGGLLMTSLADMMKGGESGPIFNFENTTESELLKRISLPLTEEAHMPPKGKSQLTADEIALLNWWVENKACEKCLVSEMQNQASVEAILQKYTQVASNLDISNIDALTDKQINKLQENGIQITSIAASNPLVAISLANQAEISKRMIQSMGLVDENISELNLSGSMINESLIDFIADLPNLQKLQLQNTQVSDKAISKIKRLKNLQSLNLYNTSISDESIEGLAQMATLEKLYLWQSKVTPKGIAQIKDARPQIEIFNGAYDHIFGEVNLNPPAIIAETNLFKDSLIITLKNDFRDCTLHYTLDGNQPDSTSAIYEKPIRLSQSSKVKAIARKKGWGISEINERQFIKLNRAITKASLAKAPAEQYKAQGAKSLIDQKESKADFRNGQWLGYQESHLISVLELEKADSVSAVYISALSDPGSWIFYPRAIHISLSNDGKNFQKVQEAPINKDHRDGTAISYFKASFKATQSKFIKVEVKSILKNPDWHPSPGEGCWLFVDEVLVN